MEFSGKSAPCFLVSLLALLTGVPVAAEPAEEFPALERYYSVDPSRNRQPAPARWSAVVQHARHIFFAWGHRTTSEANAAALEQCERQMSEQRHQCQPVLAFTQCAAQAQAYHGGQSAMAEGPSLSEAEEASLQACRDQSGDSCRLSWSYCGDGSGQVYPQEQRWGAVARPMDGGGEAILVKDRKESVTALTEANWHCEQANKRPCETLFHFAQCAAYAESANQDYYGWARSADPEEAALEAEVSCSRAAGSLCTVKLSHCQ